MKKVLHALQRLEKWIIVIAFVIMVVAIFCQVVNRNIFKIPVSGFEEAAKYSMAYMVLLGTELACVTARRSPSRALWTSSRARSRR